jgi:hypothetical protein
MKLRDDGKGRGEAGKQSGALFPRVGRILNPFRRGGRRVQLVEGPKVAARPESAPAQPSRSAPVAVTLRVLFQSLREASAALRRYEELRSKGIPHATAIRQALDIPCVRQESLQGDTGNHLRSSEQRK